MACARTHVRACMYVAGLIGCLDRKIALGVATTPLSRAHVCGLHGAFEAPHGNHGASVPSRHGWCF
eukprot:7258803-Alexandrium_andersonii.AAC.1